MKKLIYFVLSLVIVSGTLSCMKIDNYPEPGETLRGRVVDDATGELVLTDQGGEGTRVRMRELSWTQAVPENLDFYSMKEGNFQNTKVFKGRYNVRVDGAFMPLVLTNTNGDTLSDGSKTIEISGITEVEFRVQPFLKIEWQGTPIVENGKITATVVVTRGISAEAFKTAIEPTGNYNDDMVNITDLRLFVSQVPYVGYREWDNRYTTTMEFSGNSFNTQLGQPVTITTQGTILPGRTVFIRAAARINYATENIRRHNYNEAVRVDIP